MELLNMVIFTLMMIGAVAVLVLTFWPHAAWKKKNQVITSIIVCMMLLLIPVKFWVHDEIWRRDQQKFIDGIGNKITPLVPVKPPTSRPQEP